MPSNAKVMLYYGPYDAAATVEYRQARLQGLKTILTRAGHTVDLRPFKDWNNVELWVNGEKVFKCDIRKLDYVSTSTFHTGSVYCKNKQCQFRPNVLDLGSATAVGTFNDTLLTTGWGILDISAGHAKTQSSSNLDIMFAAGYIEGVFTARHMDSHYKNVRSAMLPASKVEVYNKLRVWFIKNRKWTNMMVASHGDEHPMWRHIGYILAQLDGLFEGYKSVSTHVTEPLDEFAFSFLNGVGDLLDLLKVLDRESLPDWTKFSKEEARRHFNLEGRCSALIKLLPGYEDMYMGHSTWFVYEATNRIYKHYDFNVHDPNAAAKKISFSSYPGFLVSLDDFYTLGSGMVMLQTTIYVWNYTVYDQVHPESLLAWQRVRAANMMARDGREWTDIIKKYNSGTYNNEYMLIDLKKFSPNKPLQDGTLWVAEQMPGLVVAEDLTHTLRGGYFPSYNVPYFEEIFNKIGYAEYVKTHGLDYSYDLAPRAKIFRRDQSNVRTLSDMKDLLRYNDYKNDPYSDGSPLNTICIRGDLDKTLSTTGCFDTKVSSYGMAKALQADIVSGPTLGNDLPIFSWTGYFANFSHVGLPPSYNYGFL